MLTIKSPIFRYLLRNAFLQHISKKNLMNHFQIPLLLSLVALPAFAQDEIRDQFNPVRTAVTSQSIAPDARAGGMGDVGVATDPDVHSQYWNPAKYPFTISRAGFAINYTPWLRKLTTGIALLDAAGYIRLGDYQALSASLRYFTLGEVQAEENMSVKPYELGVDVAYSRMLSEKFSAAVALRYIYSDISGHYDDSSEPGSAFAADIAMYYNTYVMMGQRECQLAWGLNINNIGSKISYGNDRSFFIPTNLRLGLSYMIPLNEYNRISFSADVNKLLVPSMPLQRPDETDEDYPTNITTNRLFRAYLPHSAIQNEVLRAKWKNCSGVSVQNTSTTKSLFCVLVIITKAKCKVTVSTQR